MRSAEGERVIQQHGSRGMELSMERRASSSSRIPLRPLDCAGLEASGTVGPGVASDGVAGTEGMVLVLRFGRAAARDAEAPARGGGACCWRASCASSSSSQCLIWRWYWMILRAFWVFGIAALASVAPFTPHARCLLFFPGTGMLCLGSLSLSSSAMRRAMAVCCRAESSFSPLGPPGRAAARFRSLGLMATLDGS